MKFCLSVILLFLFIDCSAQSYRSHFTKPDSPLYKTKLLHANSEPSYKLNFLKSDLLYQRAKILYPGNNFKRYVHDEELLAYCRDRILVDIQKDETVMGILLFTIDENGNLFQLSSPRDKTFDNIQLDSKLTNTMISMIADVPHWKPFDPKLKGKKETYILFFQLIYEKTY